MEQNQLAIYISFVRLSGCREVYRVQKELEENGNAQTSFDFSLNTAFRVVENISQKEFA